MQLIIFFLLSLFVINDPKFLKKWISAVFQASFQSSPLVIPSPGRSGAKFFISKNRKFYVKTIEGEGIERLHNILPQYHHVSCPVLLQTSALCAV